MAGQRQAGLDGTTASLRQYINAPTGANTHVRTRTGLHMIRVRQRARARGQAEAESEIKEEIPIDAQGY